jgi:hypothetical protein
MQKSKRRYWPSYQFKNPELYCGPTPEKKHRSKPVVKLDSFKKASPKVITRVGSW